MKKQPKELLRFIRGVSLTSEGLVAKTDMYPLDDRGIVYPEDLVDTEDETDTSLYMDIEEIVPVGEEDDYVSELYVPVYRVSVLSRMVHSLLLFDRFQEGGKPLQKEYVNVPGTRYYDGYETPEYVYSISSSGSGIIFFYLCIERRHCSSTISYAY
jgi:hypothetical protein